MDEQDFIELLEEEQEIVKHVCLGLVHPPEKKQEEFTRWLQRTVNFHIEQIKQKIYNG